MAAIECDVRLYLGIDPDHTIRDLLNFGELTDENAQIIHHTERFSERTIPTIEPEHILDHAIEALRIVMDNLQ